MGLTQSKSCYVCSKSKYKYNYTIVYKRKNPIHNTCKKCKIVFVIIMIDTNKSKTDKSKTDKSSTND
jgi:hypothetical protein